MGSIKIALGIVLTLFLAATSYGKTYTVKSPDGMLEASVSDGQKLLLSLKADGKAIFEGSQIGMLTDKGNLGIGAEAESFTTLSNSGSIETVCGLRKEVPDNFNQIELSFGKYKLQVRAYNEAVAYRFVTDFGDGAITVKDEILTLPWIKNDSQIISHPVRGDWTSFEENYARQKAEDLKKFHSATMPFIIQKGAYKIAIVESGLLDYPGLRIAWKKDSPYPAAYFAKCPEKLSTKKCGFELQPDSKRDYIANTDASREFPWRTFIVARKDAELADNDTVYKLARPCAISDTSWIKPGLSVWDWWVNWNTEDVDFRTGFNDEMCKYYVDFAAENSIPYVTLDSGWHAQRIGDGDPAKKAERMKAYYDDANFINGKPRVNIPEIVKYAKAKGVKVIIWVYSKVMYNHPREALDLFKSWGVAGLKIDFTDRDDQLAMRHFENISKLAAERKMIIDWHGCPPMSGMHRTYPNAINFEGVQGGEFNKFKKTVTPSHNVDIVFTRMLLGPMDYTPGGMRNVSSKNFAINNDWPNVMGTRAAEVAKYVIYYAPLQMLSDAPSQYRKSDKILKFLSRVPTSWDDSKCIEGKIGEYVVIARRSGDDWYLACLNGKKSKKIKIALSEFLEPDKTYNAEIISDGLNADRIQTYSKVENARLSASDSIELDVADEGGFAVRFSPKD